MKKIIVLLLLLFGTVSAADAAPLVPPPQSISTIDNSNIKPGPNNYLFTHPFYACSRNYYISTTGSDSNGGTSGSPWLTIQHADSGRQAGDCVHVAPGTYTGAILLQHGGNAPTSKGYVAYECETLDGCHVLANAGGHLWGLENNANFVVIDGFEVDGNSTSTAGGLADACIATDYSTYGTGNETHHVWSINNVVHDCNLAGISFNGKEYYYVLNNKVYNNSFTSGYQGSGINIVTPQCIESGNSSCASGSVFTGGTGNYTPSGMDLTSPFHIVISKNVVYNNQLTAPAITCGSHTDGNGIITDTFFDGGTNTIEYPFQTLVDYNVAYGNGARGIHIFLASYVTVANNTLYANGIDVCTDAYELADLDDNGNHNNVFYNNIVKTVVTTPVPANCTYCGGRNVSFLAGNAGSSHVLANATYSNNVFSGGTALFDNSGTYFSCSSNKCTTDPLYLNTTSNNFGLQSSSPAINYGIAEPYLPKKIAIDAGACFHTLKKCP